ncbi:ABC transporter ATP-binding protein [Leucobacter sp. W1153]|uniref:ABC transporter ATP-binding protein n=1 Tax=Leucobacter sp. W1153 TaxID=3439064 RepID=UPI003F3CEEF9
MNSETNAEPGVRIANLTKRYGAKTVVDDISIDIERGEFVTFLGPSGSGKTTTLSMIAGFTDVTSGDIEIHDRSVSAIPPHKRDIGMVFQNYALFPHRTVRGNIAFPLERRQVPKARIASQIDDALDMVYMREYAERYPQELSGGQQQRVALARALVYNPAVLLMDEPLGALDKKLRDWLQGEIKRIHREVRSTFLYVTHDQEEALSLSDRIAVFNDGRIEQLGTPQELYESPSTLFVGTFVGDSTLVRASDAQPVAGGLTEALAYGRRVAGRGSLTGEEGAVLIRPENIKLIPADAPTPDANCALPVSLLTATYLGEAWRYEFRLPDGSIGMAKVDGATRTLQPGEEALAVWAPDNAVVLSYDDRHDQFRT